MSDLYNILCIITPGDSEEEANILVSALNSFSKERDFTCSRRSILKYYLPEIPFLAVSPRDAFYSETELVPFDDSEGRIIAEFIMVYPPGIPIFIPGEIISEENLVILKRIGSRTPCSRS